MRWIGKTGSGLCFIMAMLLAGSIIICSSWEPVFAAATPVIKWRMQTVDPPALVGPSVTVPAFLENIKKMSNGRLEISLFTAGQLVPTVEIVKALKTGMIDMAYTNGVYYTGAIPEANLDFQNMPPYLFKKIEEAQEVYWYKGLDQLMREGYAEQGAYYLNTIFMGDPNTFWSKRPMHHVADVKGFKIRTFGYFAKTFAKLGATPVFIPHEEVYTSLAQGVVDGSQTAGSYYKRFKYYEVAPYYYLPGLTNSCTMNIMVSMESWKKLPDDLKAILNVACIAFSSDHVQRTWSEHDQMVQELKKLGSTLILWPDEDMAKIREAGLPFLTEIAQKGARNEKGVQIIRAYLKEKGYLK